MPLQDRVYLPKPYNHAHPLARGLASWWLCVPGWMGGFRWFDLVGTNHGTLTSMNNANNGWRSTTRPGGFGQMLFDGTAGYTAASTAIQLGSGDCTFSAWICPSSLPAASWVMNDRGTGFHSLFLSGATSVSFWCRDDSSNTCQAIGNAPVANTWQHICGVRSGTTVVLYQNGKQTGTSTNASFGAITSGAMNIGAQLASQFFPGFIDDVRVYGRALSGSEVFDLYQNSKLGYPRLLNQTKTVLGTQPYIQNYTAPAAATRPTRQITAPYLPKPYNHDHPLARGLVSWWLATPGLMGGNKWYDIVGSNHGTLTNMGGSPNGAAGFASASSQFLSIASNATVQPATGSFSIAAWVQTSSSVITQGIVFKRSTASNGFGYFVDSTGHIETRYVNGTNIQTTRTVNDGNWHFVVFTYDGTNTKVYIDTTLDSIHAQSPLDTTTTTSFCIGADLGGVSNFFNGSMDSVGWWNGYALTQAEVTALYNSGNGLQSSQVALYGVTTPTSWWNLGEATGATRNDSFGTNNLTSNNGVTLVTGVNQGVTLNGWRSTTRPGGFGQMLFDGTVGNVVAPHPAGLGNNITVSFWFKHNTATFNSANNEMLVQDRADGGSGGFFIYGNAGTSNITYQLGLVSLGNVGKGQGISNITVWNHVALTYDGNFMGCYLNGVLTNSGTFAANIDWTNPIGVYFGEDKVISSRFFNGTLDDIRIYNRALSASEVADIYQNSRQGYPRLLNQRGVNAVASFQTVGTAVGSSADSGVGIAQAPTVGSALATSADQGTAFAYAIAVGQDLASSASAATSTPGPNPTLGDTLIIPPRPRSITLVPR